MSLFGGIECGGTSFVCAIASGPTDIVSETRFATTTPTETLATAVNFFRSKRSSHTLSAMGIASFGPVDLNRSSPTYGYITTTPKSGWDDVDVAGYISRELALPVGWDTDVNATALAEHRWGNAVGLDTFVYVTVGTGIGGGALVEGRPMHGLVHPEMGHMRVPRDPNDGYPGCCPYHGDGLEALLAARLFDRGGRPCRKSFLTIIRPGNWRLDTWPRDWPTSCSLYRPAVSSSAGA